MPRFRGEQLGAPVSPDETLLPGLQAVHVQKRERLPRIPFPEKVPLKPDERKGFIQYCLLGGAALPGQVELAY